MSNSNLIAKDIQSLEVDSGVVSLFELEYSSSTTLYFHPGLSTSVRITNIDGGTLTLNSSQTITTGVSLTFKGLSPTGSEVSVTKSISGDNPDANTITVSDASSLTVGMTVTGPGIQTRDYSPIVFDTNTYYAIPMELSTFSVSTEGVQNRPKLTIGNVESILRSSSLFQNANDGGNDGLSDFKLDDLIGKRLTQRQTLEKYLTMDPTTVSTKSVIELPKRIHIIDRVENKNAETVTFELANPFDLEGIKLPRRQVIGKYCPWAYQGLTFDTPKGACTWPANSLVLDENSSGDLKFYAYLTEKDEPIMWKYLIHNSSNATQILSGKTHSGSAGTSYAKDALVALSDGGSGYTYWRSNKDSNTSVPSSSNSDWQQIRLYEPWVSGQTYSTHSDSADRNDYVIYPVNNAGNKTDTTFDFTATSTIYRVLITNNSIVPSSRSAHWTRGDVCGKLLSSCKARFQFMSEENDNDKQNTIVGTDTNTAVGVLPFGGFPGSRKHR
tara:strand:- start:5662 stop:7155 length:1494 start_codon:yes stop_codon:yes gene_type:complete